MKIIRPIEGLADLVIETSVGLDTDAEIYGAAYKAAWLPNRPGGYADLDVVRLGQDLYRSLVDSNTSDPAASSTGSSPSWQLLGKINRYRMFDEFISNSSTHAEDEISVKLALSGADHVALYEVEGNVVTAEVLDREDNVLWVGSRDLLAESLEFVIRDIYDYFFAPYPPARRDVVIPLGIPPWGSDRVRVTISGSGRVECGRVHAGYAVNLGDLLFAPRASGMGFGRNVTDDFGRTFLRKGARVKLTSGRVHVPVGGEDAVYRELLEAMETACVWDLNNEGTRYDFLVNYGVVEDYDVVMQHERYTLLNLSIKGLT